MWTEDLIEKVGVLVVTAAVLILTVVYGILRLYR